MQITILKQGGGALFQQELARGFNYLGGPVRAILTPAGNVHVGADVMDGDGAGAVHHAGIELREGRSKVVFGGPGDVIQGRGSVRIRRVVELHDDPDFAYASGPRIPWAPSFRPLSVWWEYPKRMSGPYVVTGERQRDTGGAKGIQPLSGFEADSRGVVERSDAAMNRTPIGAFSRTGQPWSALDFDYSDDFAWSAATQLPQVCDRVSGDPWDGRRKPKAWNQGACAYLSDLCGWPNLYDSWICSNHQHVRDLFPAIAAMNRGDDLAKIDVEMRAHNAWMAQPTTPAARAGEGSGYYGRRETAHRMLAWLHSERYSGMARAHIEQTCIAQMPNSAIENLTYDPNLNPNPWNALKMWPKHWRVMPTMEQWLTLNILARAGKRDAVHKGLAGIFDVLPQAVLNSGVPKFVVTQKGDVPERTFTAWAGDSDFFPWLALGALAALDPRHPDWQRWCLMIPVPREENRGGRRATSLRDLRDMLRVWQSGRSQTVGLLSVLETMAL